MPLVEPMGLGQQEVGGFGTPLRDPCSDVAPAWCDYFGGLTNFFEACQPIDPRACQEAGLRQTRMTPQNIQRALDAGDQTIAADMRANPQLYTEYQSWLKWKPVYELDPKKIIESPDFTPYVIGAVALGAVWLLMR